MVTNQEMNARKEPGCVAILTDKKYFHVGNTCMKRTLRRHEWQTLALGQDRVITPTPTYPQRWKNDAAILEYLGKHTDIPLPRLQCVYEDDGAFHHCTEYVPGTMMIDLPEEDKKVVQEELHQYIATLRALRSETPGVPGQPLLTPHLIISGLRWKPNSCWRPRVDVKGEFVFCHNDLGQHNIIVDPDTLKVKAVIDWEFGGFWPEWFERAYWTKLRPFELEGENEHKQRCRQWLLDHCDEVVMSHLHPATADKEGEVN